MLSTLLATHRLRALKVEAAIPEVDATLYGASGAPHHPLVRACVPEANADVSLGGGGGGVASHHVINIGAALELLTWSRAAHAWEPCLARTATSLTTQQVRAQPEDASGAHLLTAAAGHEASIGTSPHRLTRLACTRALSRRCAAASGAAACRWSPWSSS